MSSPSSRTRSAPRSAVRRDLQGLRGIGVVFVVVGHLWQQPPGAFAMLDMFFVLSGFWITTILVDNFQEHGPKFAIVFYLNRIRRLVPAATLVLAVTTGLFYLVYSSARGWLVAVDAFWALIFWSNWHSIAVGTDYFHDHSPSPFVHYWSLSIEEQFYAVWPFLLLLVIYLARRARRRSPEVFLLAALALVTVTFFAYSLWHSTADPMAAYFSTFDRVWEFGVGGILGILAPRLARMPRWLGVALGWGGFVGIIVTVFVIPLGVAFPAPYGLIPVLLTGAILVGGIDRDTRYVPMLDNPVSVYVGDISYSLYLWHLPIAVLLTAWFPLGDPMFYVSALTLSFGASIATYYLVERPMRYAGFLMTPPERERRRPQSPSQRQKNRQLGLGALGAALVAAICVAALAPASVSASGSLPRLGLIPVSGNRHPTLVDVQQRALGDALEQASFPKFDPPLEDLGTGNWQKAEEASGCTGVQAGNLADCRFGSGRKLAVVVGDSYAIAWMPGIRTALEPRGWTVQQMTLPECPAWTLPSYRYADNTPYDECADHHELVRHVVDADKPDLVILASAALNVRNAERDDIAGTGEQVARRGLAASLHDLQRPGSRVVVLGSPPAHASLLTCVTRVGSPADCVSGFDDDWHAATDGEEQAAEAAGARFVQTQDWFCDWGRCPGFVGRTPVTYDGAHLTIDYSRQLAPLIREALLGTPSVASG